MEARSLFFDAESGTGKVLVEGQAVEQLPQDLYIPPDALRVVLDAFEGPLDLLLYLIRKQNLDILNIPVAKITGQYMQYVEMMRSLDLELAAEYLLMAAILTEIKSRMLLPRPIEEDDEDDPRAELVRRLQEYEIFKHVAKDLDEMPRIGRDNLTVHANPPAKAAQALPTIELKELLIAFADVIKRAEMFSSHHINREPLSVRARMSTVLAKIKKSKMVRFTELFSAKEGKSGAVVSLLAILELLKEQLIDIVQAESSTEIYIKPKLNSD